MQIFSARAGRLPFFLCKRKKLYTANRINSDSLSQITAKMRKNTELEILKLLEMTN